MVRDLAARLRSVEDAGSALSWLVPELFATLGTSGGGSYRMQRTVDGLRVSSGSFVGGRQVDVMRAFDHWLTTTNAARWVLYDPYNVAAPQRNHLVVVPRPSEMLLAKRVPRWADRARALHDLDRAVVFLDDVAWNLPTARILVCDGPRMLAYVGWTSEPGFAPEHRAVLRALVPAIVRRVRIEEQLDRDALGSGAIDALIEALPRAAFVVGRRGAIMHANAAARTWFELDRAAVVSALTRGRAPDPAVFEVVELIAHRCYLAIRRASPPDVALRATEAARRWGLTPREAEVLAQLARGATNARIAAELGCAEATVEIHVSRILAKADVGNRAELVAAVWSA